MEAGAEDDTFVMFQGGGLQYPLDNAPVWRYIAKDGLKSPPVTAVEEFRKAVEESEKGAAQKQQATTGPEKKSVRQARRLLHHLEPSQRQCFWRSKESWDPAH
jgi:hypothetical protein